MAADKSFCKMAPVVLLIMLPTCTFFTTLCESKPITARLIYHSSKLSRFYNATATVEDLARRETDISFERLRALDDYHQQLPSSSLITRSSNDEDDDDSTVVVHTSTIDANIIAPPRTPLFMVEMFIGERPPFYQRLFLDTGSSLLWVFCSRPGDYEAWKSTSYSELLCGMTTCSASGLGTCEGREGMPCSYYLRYETGYNEGVLAKENFKFERSGPSIPFVLFGCARTSTVPFQIEYDGILGIGPRSTSIINQKIYYGFSYCLGNLSDPSYVGNILIIWNTGAPALDSLYSTPLLFLADGSHYGAQLVEILIASELLPLPFPEGLGIAVFDTGASVTYLTEEVYQRFQEAIIYAIGGRLDRSYMRASRLCYNGNLQRDLQWFPTISFHFLNDTFMDVGPEHLFIQQSPEVLCLAVLPREATQSNRYSPNIIGARMQQYFYVSYKLLGKRQLNIKRFDCKNVTTDDDDML